MKNKTFSVSAVITAVMALICAVLFALQTVPLVLFEEHFPAEHPAYVMHSWYLLAIFLAAAVLATVSRRSRSLARCCVISAVTVVLAILAMQGTADHHYYMGILRDLGIYAPFDAGWLLLALSVALIIATAVQFLIPVFSALAKDTGK